MIKDPRSFDAALPAVAAMFFVAHDQEFTVGTPITIVPDDHEKFGPGELTLDETLHLWTGGRVDYADNARPTPVETPEQEAARLTHESALLDASEAARVIPSPFEAREAGSNGVYEITGPGIEPYKIRGKANAEAEVERLNGKASPEPVEVPTAPAGEVVTETETEPAADA